MKSKKFQNPWFLLKEIKDSTCSSKEILETVFSSFIRVKLTCKLMVLSSGHYQKASHLANLRYFLELKERLLSNAKVKITFFLLLSQPPSENHWKRWKSTNSKRIRKWYPVCKYSKHSQINKSNWYHKI